MVKREKRKKVIEIKNEYLFQLVEHDTVACEAWREFQSIPFKVTIHDLIEMAMKYKTTPDKMRRHKKCC